MTSDGTAEARILIVDDEPLNLDLLQQELEDRGYAVELAENGQEALDRVAASPPDVILLDVLMPVLDGIETCRALKNDPDTALIPVIIMTALTAVEDRIRGIQAGADEFLSKPVDDRELLARIETALRTKHAVDRTRRELESATEQLMVVGQLDRDATVMVVSGDDAQLDSVRAALADSDGREIDRAERCLRWVFLDPDPTTHAAEGARAALMATASRDVAVALESGSVLIDPQRIEQSTGSRWQTSAAGPAVDAALDIVRHAAPGQAVMGPEAAQRLESVIEMTALPGRDIRLLDGEMTSTEADPQEPTTLQWPDEYGSVQEPLLAAWGVSAPIYLTRSLSGKSGARVYLVDITSEGFSGQAILKLDLAPHEDKGEDEAHRHRRAIGTNPGYAEQRIPRIVHTLTHNEMVATLSTIAGRGLEFVLPWAHVDYQRQLDTASVISHGILVDWNAEYELSDLITPHDLLDAWLGYRLDPTRGRIVGFLQSLGIEPAEPSFTCEGRWYPNPYAFAVGAQSVPPRTAIRAARGNIHGDLHGFNLLVHANGDPDAYYVIDLALYEEDTFLMYDNAYFELTHLLHTRETTTVRRWLELIRSARGSGAHTSDDYGLLHMVSAIRSGVREWIDQAEPNRLAYMESQYSLARVAVGLNFVHKRVSDHLKLLSFLYAALTLKSYIKFQAIDWPRTGPELTN